MIFKQWQQVLDGTKTQTRRLVGESEACRDGMSVAKSWAHVVLGTTGHRAWMPYYPKWQVGRTYAIQPGRGKKAVGRIRITKIRRERVQDISREDAIAEGIYDTGWFGWSYGTEHCFARPIRAFRGLWNSIYEKAPHRFEDNLEVWVLTFERVKDG